VPPLSNSTFRKACEWVIFLKNVPFALNWLYLTQKPKKVEIIPTKIIDF
jgi:hypothetical protein